MSDNPPSATLRWQHRAVLEPAAAARVSPECLFGIAGAVRAGAGISPPAGYYDSTVCLLRFSRRAAGQRRRCGSPHGEDTHGPSQLLASGSCNRGRDINSWKRAVLMLAFIEPREDSRQRLFGRSEGGFMARPSGRSLLYAISGRRVQV